MISRTCAAVRSGRSRLSANASSSIRPACAAPPPAAAGTSASNPPARYARIQSIQRRAADPDQPPVRARHAPAQPARGPAGRARPSTDPGRRRRGSTRTGTARSPGDGPHPLPVLPALAFTSAGPSQLTAPPARGNSCCQQHPPDSTRGDPPRIARPEPQHPRPRRDRDRLQRVRDAAPGRQHRPELRIQRDRPAREMRPDPLSPLGEPPQPATHRVRRAPPTAQRSADTPRRRPSPRSPRRSPPPRPAGATTPHPAAARACPRTPDTAPAAAATTDPPTEQRSTRSRACPHGPNTPRHDGHPSSPPTSSASTSASSAHTINIGCHLRHPREPSRRTTKQTGGLSRVHERAKPATTASRHHHDERHEHPRPCPNSAALNIRVLVEHRLHPGSRYHAHDRLRDPVRDSRHP